jgi:transposase
MQLPRDMAHMNAQELRDLATSLFVQVTQQSHELKAKQLKIDQLTHEMAVLKRWQFGRRSERLDPAQRSLLEETIDADLEAIERELEALQTTRPVPAKAPPRRAALPAHLPRRDIPHEPDNTVCPCGCQLERIGEEISERLDYQPGTFAVERHVRGKWVCRRCETLIQAPIPAQIIDKGIPSAGLLAHVLISKFADHIPLYRLEGILERSEVAIPCSTLGAWVGACGVQLAPLAEAMKTDLLKRTVLHADETPVSMLKPGLGHTHRAYIWSYGSTQFDAAPLVVYDFTESRGGHHARAFLGGWSGKLVCDDFSGYKALFERNVIEAGCMAHCPELRFIWGASNVTAEILGQRRPMTPDNNRRPIRWRRGRQADQAWATRRVCEWAKGRSGPRNARGHRASSVGWCSRSGSSSRCWHARGSRGLLLYRHPLAIMRPRNCAVAHAV